MKGTWRYLLFGMLLIVLAAGTALAYDRGHAYISGTVEAIGKGTIRIAGADYELAPDCGVYLQERKNGAFFKRGGDLRDIHTGDRVYAKKIGQTVLEIEVERW